jgi:hypothetical protein
MVQKAKILYFTVFILVVFAFIFHVTAMGHHHWKKATPKNPTGIGLTHTAIGLFTRCESLDSIPEESCFLNKYPFNTSCNGTACLATNQNDNCQCDFLPSTKGIASCAIIASVFLGIATIVLFIHSIKTTETRTVGLLLGFLPLLLLLLAFIFILITLILVGSYLSRDIMATLRTNSSTYILENDCFKNDHKSI